MTKNMLPVFSGTNLVLALAILGASVSRGQEWTRFRGPNGQGISRAKTIPVKWTEDDYNWKVKLPGGGHSSPVLWGEKLFVTSGDRQTGKSVIFALNVSDGKVLWQKEYSLSKYRPNKLNSFASATPTVDADHVYVLFTSPEETILAALNHQGKEIWKRTFEGVLCQHGAGSSPIVHNDMIIFTHEHEDKSSPDARSVWFAVSRKTGETRWTLDRQTGPKTSYSTPCVYTPAGGKPQLIFNSHSHGMTSVNPGTGKVIWEVVSAFPARVVSSPVIADELLIGSCGDGGSGKRLIAIRPGSSDGSIQPKEAYSIDSGYRPYVPTSIAKAGLLFTFLDRGYVSCWNSATGRQLWEEKPAGKFFSSPVCVDGKLYCITMDGDVVVVRAAETYELLAINPLGETSHSAPAVSGGRMYLRTYSQLFSIGSKKRDL
ncbi:MAG: PQQ-binding-like beta-propeller repeat protein [Planctomycetota bacterium]|jgi:outer membrane protein assembly factor BamB